MNQVMRSRVNRSMDVPLPTGSLAGGWSAALTVGGTKDAPSIFAGNLGVTGVRCLNLLQKIQWWLLTTWSG